MPLAGLPGEAYFVARSPRAGTDRCHRGAARYQFLRLKWLVTPAQEGGWCRAWAVRPRRPRCRGYSMMPIMQRVRSRGRRLALESNRWESGRSVLSAMLKPGKRFRHRSLIPMSPSVLIPRLPSQERTRSCQLVNLARLVDAGRVHAPVVGKVVDTAGRRTDDSLSKRGRMPRKVVLHVPATVWRLDLTPRPTNSTLGEQGN